MRRLRDLIVGGAFAVAAALIVAFGWLRPGLLAHEILAGVFFVAGGAFAGFGKGMLLDLVIHPSKIEEGGLALPVAVFGFPFVLLYTLAEGVIPLIGYGASTELFTPLAVLSFLATALVTFVVKRS